MGLERFFNTALSVHSGLVRRASGIEEGGLPPVVQTEQGIGLMPWVRPDVKDSEFVVAPNADRSREFTFQRVKSFGSDGGSGIRECDFTRIMLHNVGHEGYDGKSKPFVTEREKLMEIAEHRYHDGEIENLIYVYATDPQVQDHIQTVMYAEDGVKRVLNGVASLRKHIHDPHLIADVMTTDQLPARIDFEATKQSFLDQARELNFKKPELVLPVSS